MFCHMNNPFQLGWFATSRGTGSLKLLQAMQSSIISGEANAEIAFVFCNREYGEAENTDRFLRAVEEYKIPLVTYSYHRFKDEHRISEIAQPETLPDWRLEYDREVMERLKGFNPGLIVLAGYMLVVGKEICRKYNMVNLHPAAPGGPAGTWQEVIWKLIDSRAVETGVMMHMVTPELDRGTPVTYCTFPVRGEPFDKLWEEIKGQSLEEMKQGDGENGLLFRRIREHGFARELPLVTATVKAFSHGKVIITPDKKVVDAAGNAICGYDLTCEINKLLKEVT